MIGKKEKIVLIIAAVAVLFILISKGLGLKVIAFGILAYYAYRFWKIL